MKQIMALFMISFFLFSCTESSGEITKKEENQASSQERILSASEKSSIIKKMRSLFKTRKAHVSLEYTNGCLIEFDELQATLNESSSRSYRREFNLFVATMTTSSGSCDNQLIDDSKNESVPTLKQDNPLVYTALASLTAKEVDGKFIFTGNIPGTSEDSVTFDPLLETVVFDIVFSDKRQIIKHEVQTIEREWIKNQLTNVVFKSYGIKENFGKPVNMLTDPNYHFDFDQIDCGKNCP